jgi:2-C-methyl-D-erythritol 4-phosphate cytidylyltransferase
LTRFSPPERVSAEDDRPVGARTVHAPSLRVAVILVAAGSGVRLGAGMPKAFAPLCGESLLTHALRGVLGCAEVKHVVIVAPPSHVGRCRAAADHLGQHCRVDVVAGGEDRSASVEAGLGALRPGDGIVLVHDVARALAPSDLFARVIDAVRDGHPAVVPGVPVTDTVKVVDNQDCVLDTLDRGSLRSIQTPQGFLRGVLELAHAHIEDTLATDDAGLVERNGGHVHVVAGDHRALKITSPVDLTVATALIQDGLYAR